MSKELAAQSASYLAKAAAEKADPKIAKDITSWCEAGLDETLPEDDWTELMAECLPDFDLRA